MSVLIDRPATWIPLSTAVKLLGKSNTHSVLKLALVGEIAYRVPAGRNPVFSREDVERLARARSSTEG
jgi:hypothetical protein